LRATVDVHIHYSFGPENTGALITRWLVLDITMPVIARPVGPGLARRDPTL